MKAGQLKMLMEESKEDLQARLLECQVEINQRPKRAVLMAVKMAGIMKNISNVDGVLKVLETLDPNESIIKEGV